MPSNQRHLEQAMTCHSKTEQDIERAEREVALFDQKTPYDHGHVSNEMRAWLRFQGIDPYEIKNKTKEKR